MYNDTVTIFCRSTSTGETVWYPHVVYGVNLQVDRAAIVAKYGEQSQDAAALNIRYAVEDGKVMVWDKPWLASKAWESQTEDEKSRSIKFTPGQSFDFFAAGVWDDDTPVHDSDYGIDGFYDYVNKVSDYVYAITSVTKYDTIPHFEIMGK